METKKITVSNYEKDSTISLYSIFKYNVESTKDLGNGKSTIILSRNVEEKYQLKLALLEDEYIPKFIPLFVTFLPGVLAFILVTIFLVLFLINKENPDFEKMKMMTMFFIPSGILLFLTVVLNYFRTKKYENYLNNKDKLLKEAQNKVKELFGE